MKRLLFALALIVPSFSFGKILVMQNLFILTADMAQVQVSDLKKLVARGAQGFELPGSKATMADAQRLAVYTRAMQVNAAKANTVFPIGLNVAVDKDHDPSSLDPKIRQAGIDYLKSRIDMAVVLGATTVAGPIALPWGGFYPTANTNILHDEFLNPKLRAAKISMRVVADYAKSKGINLAVEPLHRHEMHGINTMVETAKFIKSVDRPNFGVCIDPSHEVIDGHGPKLFEKLVTDLYNRGFYIYAQISPPSRGAIEEDTWIPKDFWRELLMKLGVTTVTIEMMQATEPFTGADGAGIRLSRRPFRYPLKVAQTAIATVNKWFNCDELEVLGLEKNGS